MTRFDRPHETHICEWRGTRIEIRYCPDYSRPFSEIHGHPLAHLTLRSIAPPKQPLPITGTGYLSHFTTPDLIAEAGGPVAFVRAALDKAADTAAWRNLEATANQYTLF